MSEPLPRFLSKANKMVDGSARYHSTDAGGVFQAYAAGLLDARGSN